MSKRWSLSNSVLPISHLQFRRLTEAFQQAAECSFGVACKLQIKTMRATKGYTTYVDDMIENVIEQENRGNMLLETDKLDEATREAWRRAKYVEVVIRPADENKAPASAFARLEFKGDKPRQATFFIQPNGDEAKKMVLSS